MGEYSSIWLKDISSGDQVYVVIRGGITGGLRILSTNTRTKRSVFGVKKKNRRSRYDSLTSIYGMVASNDATNKLLTVNFPPQESQINTFNTFLDMAAAITGYHVAEIPYSAISKMYKILPYSGSANTSYSNPGQVALGNERVAIQQALILVKL